MIMNENSNDYVLKINIFFYTIYPLLNEIYRKLHLIQQNKWHYPQPRDMPAAYTMKLMLLAHRMSTILLTQPSGLWHSMGWRQSAAERYWFQSRKLSVPAGIIQGIGSANER